MKWLISGTNTNCLASSRASAPPPTGLISGQLLASFTRNHATAVLIYYILMCDLMVKGSSTAHVSTESSDGTLLLDASSTIK